MNFRKDLGYVLKEDHKISADTLRSFYELKELKLLLEKLSSRMQENDLKDANHIMKKILREEHHEEKLISNLEKIFRKSYTSFSEVMKELSHVIKNQNEYSRLSNELVPIQHELAELIKIMQKNGSFEESINKAETHLNYLKPVLHEINLIMEKHQDLLRRLKQLDEEIERLEQEV